MYVLGYRHVVIHLVYGINNLAGISFFSAASFTQSYCLTLAPLPLAPQWGNNIIAIIMTFSPITVESYADIRFKVTPCQQILIDSRGSPRCLG